MSRTVLRAPRGETPRGDSPNQNSEDRADSRLETRIGLLSPFENQFGCLPVIRAKREIATLYFLRTVRWFH